MGKTGCSDKAAIFFCAGGTRDFPEPTLMTLRGCPWVTVCLLGQLEARKGRRKKQGQAVQNRRATKPQPFMEKLPLTSARDRWP